MSQPLELELEPWVAGLGSPGPGFGRGWGVARRGRAGRGYSTERTPGRPGYRVWSARLGLCRTAAPAAGGCPARVWARAGAEARVGAPARVRAGARAPAPAGGFLGARRRALGTRAEAGAGEQPGRGAAPCVWAAPPPSGETRGLR